MKIGSIILLVLEIVLLVSLLMSCVPHQFDRYFLKFSHGGVNSGGFYDKEAYGSVVTDHLTEITGFKFVKKFSDDYHVRIYYYTEDYEYIDCDVLMNSSDYLQYHYEVSKHSLTVWDGLTPIEKPAKYIRIVLTLNDEGSRWTNFDLLTLPFKFKFYVDSSAPSKVEEWFGFDYYESGWLPSTFDGIDYGSLFK